MSAKKLHVIAFDIPFPANYGGVIDVFYKLKALHQLGVQVELHLFQYAERKPQAILEKIAKKVHYYRRETSFLQQFSTKPYIAVSRKNKQLLHNLLQDDAPILAEGLHCSMLFENVSLYERIKVVRMHNIEWQYYFNLSKTTTTWWKKLFFRLESLRLKTFEKSILTKANVVLSISKDDDDYFQKKHENVAFVSAFHPFEQVEINTQMIGKYALFHGSLDVSDNEQAALYLIKKVFSKTDFPLIIAGKNASKTLIQATQRFSHIEVKSNLTKSQMEALQKEAQIHVLHTFQSAGMKLKLLASLYIGRHCIISPLMAESIKNEAASIYVSKSATQTITLIEQLRTKQFTSQNEKERIELLKSYSNLHNAQKIVDKIFQ